MLIDNANRKRYTYTARNYLALKDSVIKITRFAPLTKGTITLSLPVATIFDITSTNRQYQSAGVFGLKAGVDFCNKDDRYASISLGAATVKFAEHMRTGYVEAALAFYLSVRKAIVTYKQESCKSKISRSIC